jgi:hypothetical protein
VSGGSNTMKKQIHMILDVDNTKDVKFVFQKIDEMADLVGMDKVQLSMRNRDKWWRFWKK